uniref:Uncharacterized protein n=1 Tax=Arundo donax TaxID=35708 RepID=A0A0A9G197_ARUDO
MRTLFPTACVNRDPQPAMILLLACKPRSQSSSQILIAIPMYIEQLRNKVEARRRVHTDKFHSI